MFFLLFLRRAYLLVVRSIIVFFLLFILEGSTSISTSSSKSSTSTWLSSFFSYFSSDDDIKLLEGERDFLTLIEFPRPPKTLHKINEHKTRIVWKNKKWLVFISYKLYFKDNPSANQKIWYWWLQRSFLSTFISLGLKGWVMLSPLAIFQIEKHLYTSCREVVEPL
jgi:hypothetical protein